MGMSRMFYLLLVLSFLGLMVLPAVFLLDPSELAPSEPAPSESAPSEPAHAGLDHAAAPVRFAPAQALRYEAHPVVAPRRNRS